MSTFSIFILPPFEIEKNVTMPETKKELVELIHSKKVFAFHHNVCTSCHNIPEPQRWIQDTDFKNMKITATIKRQGEFNHWEPLYVGTNNDPLFDERLYYEGAIDKMPQVYEMCLQDYNFNILSNAFLIYKNGIKKKEDAKKGYLIGYAERKKFIEDVVIPEIKAKYKDIAGCRMFEN